MSPEDPGGRKPYRKPQLREYGDLRRVTETVVGPKGRHDSAFVGRVQLKTAG